MGLQGMIVQSNKHLLLDFVTVVDNEAQLITEGLTAEEQATEDRGGIWIGYGYKAKSEREAGFPLQLLERGYTIDVTQANASREDDKRIILNTILGNVPPESLKSHEPDLSSLEFSKVNRRLRGMFAAPAVNKASKGGHLQVTLECLQTDVEREELRLDFRGCRDVGAFGEWVGLARMQGLLQLNVEEGEALAVLPASICELAQLQELDLKNARSLVSLPPGE